MGGMEVCGGSLLVLSFKHAPCEGIDVGGMEVCGGSLLVPLSRLAPFEGMDVGGKEDCGGSLLMLWSGLAACEESSLCRSSGLMVCCGGSMFGLTPNEPWGGNCSLPLLYGTLAVGGSTLLV